MAYKYSFTKLCSQDLDEAINYISNVLYNKTAAQNLFTNVMETINDIVEFPYLFSNCSIYLIDDDNIRHALINNFVLIYHVDKEKNEINLLRFQFSGRNLADINLISE